MYIFPLHIYLPSFSLYTLSLVCRHQGGSVTCVCVVWGQTHNRERESHTHTRTGYTNDIFPWKNDIPCWTPGIIESKECNFANPFECWWIDYHFKNTCSPITLVNISSINLVFMFRCSTFTGNPVHVRTVDFSLLLFSLSSHRHSYIGFVFRTRFLNS